MFRGIRRRTLIELCKCRAREFVREPSAMIWVALMPVLWMLVLGYTFSGPFHESYKIGWIAGKGDTTRTSQAAGRLQAESEVIRIEQFVDETSAQKALLRSAIDAYFWLDLDGSAKVFFESSRPEGFRGARGLEDRLQRLAGRQDPVGATLTPVNIPGSRYIDFLVPGLLAISIMTSSLFGIGMTLVANRREGTLMRFLVTPMRKSEYVLSHVFGRLLVLAFEFVVILSSAYLFFGFVPVGHFLDLLFFCVLGATCFTLIATSIAARTTSIPAVGGMLNLVMLPMVITSGAFFSTQNFPIWLSNLSKLLPLYSLTSGLRALSVEGVSILSLGTEVSILCVYAVLGLLYSALRFKWF